MEARFLAAVRAGETGAASAVDLPGGLRGLLSCQGASGELAEVLLELVEAELRRQLEPREEALRCLALGDEELQGEVSEALRDALRRAGLEAWALNRRRGGRLRLAVQLALPAGSGLLLAQSGGGRAVLLSGGLCRRLLPEGEEGSRPLGLVPSVSLELLRVELQPGDRVLLLTPSAAERLGPTETRSLLGALPLKDALGALLRLASVPPRPALGLLGLERPALAGQLGEGPELAALARTPLFAYCTPGELRDVARAARSRPFRAGELLFEQGEPGDALYLLVEGRVSLLRDGLPLLELGPGASFGEMALLDEPLRSATARAEEDGLALLLERSTFFELLGGDPVLAVKVLWNLLLRLSQHLRRTTGRLAELARRVDGG